MSSPQTTTTETDLAQVAEAIRGAQKFVVTTHENPDGDALGSTRAMTLALGQLGKELRPDRRQVRGRDGLDTRVGVGRE